MPTYDQKLEALSLAYRSGLIGWYDWITQMRERIDELYPLVEVSDAIPIDPVDQRDEIEFSIVQYLAFWIKEKEDAEEAAAKVMATLDGLTEGWRRVR